MRLTLHMFQSLDGVVQSPGGAVKLNGLPKYVASTTLRDPSWRGTEVIEGDLAENVTELNTFPVVLGRGLRLFGDGVPPTALRHTDVRTTPSGVAIHSYEPAGRPTFGTVEDVS